MSLRSTPLSRIIARMQRWTSILKTEEQYLVEDLDSAIYNRTRNFLMPWMLKKTSIRVFRDVFEYPVESDYIAIGYMDSSKEGYSNKARPYYTSIIEFFQDPNNRSQIAEIWEDGSVRYGIRNKSISASTQTLSTAESTTGWLATGVATGIVLDEVNQKEGSACIRFTVSGAGTATISNPIDNQVSDGDYKKKYHFKWVYLDVVPTSIKLRYMVDDTNYLETTGITTQFSGAALKADAWNLVAHDLNLATATGTIGTTPTFTEEEIDLVGATAGTYFIDTSSVKQWELMDNWYYGRYMVKTLAASVPDLATFMDDNGVYSTDSELVCDDRFMDVIMYEALSDAAADRENSRLQELFTMKSEAAWQDLKDRYPSIEPMMITHRYRFMSQMGRVAKPYYSTYASNS